MRFIKIGVTGVEGIGLKESISSILPKVFLIHSARFLANMIRGTFMTFIKREKTTMFIIKTVFHEPIEEKLKAVTIS